MRDQLRDACVLKGLSDRETEIVKCVAKGITNHEAGKELFVTEKTVKFHLTNIYKKINVKSRAQLIVWALPHLGFIETKPQELPKAHAPYNSSLTEINNCSASSLPVGNQHI